MSQIYLDANVRRPHFIFLKIFILLLSSLFITACAPKVERQFKQGCRGTGLNSKTCSCVYQKLEQHYGVETLKKIVSIQQLPPEGYQEITLQHTLQCAAKHQ